MACACSSMAKVSVSEVKTAEVSKVGTVGMVEEIKMVKDVGFHIWRAPQVDDKGVKKAANWKQAASLGVAIINTLMALKIARMQRDIAAKYRDMFLEDHNRYMNTYSPREKEYMLSLGEAPIYKERYRERGDQYSQYASASIRGAEDWAGYIEDQIPLCTDHSIYNDRAMFNGMLQAGALDTAYTQENYDKIVHDDLRFHRRADALDRGRSLVVSSADFADKASGLYGQLGKGIGTAAEGAMGALGYFGARQNSGYPTGVTSYDAVDNSHQEVGAESGNLRSVGGLTNPITSPRTA